MIFCLPTKGRIYSIGKEEGELMDRSDDTQANKVLSFVGGEGITNALKLFFFLKGTSECNSMHDDDVIGRSAALL